MTVSMKSSRRSLFVGAALLAAVALVLVLGVIPPVKSDIFPLATPQRAAAAFWIHAVLDILAAIVLVSISSRATARARPSTAVLIVLAVLVLLLGAAITDAAFAFRAHGPAMQSASLLLFL